MYRTVSKCLVLVFVALFCLVSVATAGEQEAVDLFNGKDLSGWDAFLVEDDVKMEDVWSVQDGILVCQGEPLGYLFTKKEFTNFKLVVEWRWAPGKEAGNNGVLLRIAGDAVSFLPRCVEVQLRSGDAGDIWAFHGAKVEGDQERFREVEGHEQIGDFAGVGKIQDAEKEPGRWNRCEITFQGPDLTVVVNGKKVNKATGCDVVAGNIGLQSEGGEIHFRTVRLHPLQ